MRSAVSSVAVSNAAAVPRVSASVARKLLLAGQGLLDDPRRRATLDAVYATVHGLGYVQLDSINVVERAHHLILGARLDGYRTPMLEALTAERRLFEHWTHDAAAIPTELRPYWSVQFERFRKVMDHHRWWRERLGKDRDQVLAEVRGRLEREGPLRARDFEETRPAGVDRKWWGWKPQKAALEYLWLSGEVAVVRRESFHKVYDLTERVLQPLDGKQPSAAEHLAWVCRSALERLGIATVKEIASFWHAVNLEEAQGWCREAVSAGEIVRVEVETEDGSRPYPAFALPGWEARSQKLPPAPPRLRLLAPFDPIVWDRRRALRLFGFDYRFEAFVPGAKRRHGYYVLPVLEGERLVGRLDAKLERDRGTLVVKGLWWEPGVRETATRGKLLASALDRLARLTGAERWA